MSISACTTAQIPGQAPCILLRYACKQACAPQADCNVHLQYSTTNQHKSCTASYAIRWWHFMLKMKVQREQARTCSTPWGHALCTCPQLQYKPSWTITITICFYACCRLLLPCVAAAQIWSRLLQHMDMWTLFCQVNFDMPCCTVLNCHFVMCCVMLRCVVPCCALLCSVIMWHAELCYAWLAHVHTTAGM